MTSTTSRSKKILAPLAVLLAAGALAVGSGATFTSASSSTIDSVTSGTLEVDNNGIGFGDSLENLRPGDVRTGKLTLTNDGSLAADLTLTQVAPTNTFVNKALTLEVIETGASAPIYSGTFEALGSKPLGVLAAESSKEYQFTVKLAGNAGNENQNKNAKASFTWDAIQTSN